jgi:uncharacterized repeat protein (TIGR03803 family)
MLPRIALQRYSSFLQLERKRVLHQFTGDADGNFPDGPLARDAEGNLYGEGETGGGFSPEGFGVVFKLDPSGKETVLYTFTGGADGGFPTGGVVRDASGNLYGITIVGGASAGGQGGGFGVGVVFKVDPSGNETVLYNFTGGADGGFPTSLILDAAGNLYGTTEQGGSFGDGVVFKLTPE